jgi:hypothetical protein
MKDKLTFILLYLLGLVLGIVLTVMDVRAQQPAPTEHPAPKAQSEPKETGPYTVTSSVEIGVRGVSVRGNASKYRSDLNYDPGFQVFNSSLLMRSNDNAGKPFDTLMINSFGWGNSDPNQYLRVNAEKTKWYRFDGNYRRIDYFNSLTNHALNQHNFNTQHRIGDFDLTMLPQNRRIRFNAGYSMTRNSGPAVTTYDYARDEFPVFAPTRVRADDYRVGVDAKLSVFDLSFQQGFRYFKEDTTYLVSSLSGAANPAELTSAAIPGNNPANTSVIESLHRDLPTRGRIPYTRFSLHTLLAKRLDITGRFIYQSATTRYSLFETITGKDASNNNIKLDQFNISGNAKRPNAIGDIGVTFLATDKLRISDTVRINSFRITGGQELHEALFRTRTTPGGETELPPVFVDTLSFRTTRYRRAVNTIEVDYDFHQRFSAHIGHRYSDRHIELDALDRSLAQPTPSEHEPEVFDNRTNTIFWGFRAKPVKMWSIYFDYERGESDNVFTRVDNYDFTNVRVRSIFRPTRTLAINASVVTKDNNNPTLTENVPRQNFGADINSRIYTSSVDWSPNEKFSLSSGYTRTHITSDAAIIFFANGVRAEGLSRYFLRDNFAFLNMYVQPHSRLSLYGGYRIHHDRGQGERASSPTVLIGSYPQQFQSPEFRVAVKLHDRVDWNAGYQYFDFQEKFPNLQRYQAHLPYTSLRIYFNRGKGE